MVNGGFWQPIDPDYRNWDESHAALTQLRAQGYLAPARAKGRDAMNWTGWEAACSPFHTGTDAFALREIHT